MVDSNGGLNRTLVWVEPHESPLFLFCYCEKISPIRVEIFSLGGKNNGEVEIRTLGEPYGPQRFSRPPLSTTQPPLQYL